MGTATVRFYGPLNKSVWRSERRSNAFETSCRPTSLHGLMCAASSTGSVRSFVTTQRRSYASMAITLNAP